MRMYRGKRIEGKGWVYGGYSEQRICKPDGMLYLIHATDKTYEVIPESVGQSTGPVGRNGIDVYGGDIIVCRKWIGGNFVETIIEKGFVDYKEGAFWLHRKQGFYRPLAEWFKDYEIEVIGNNIDGVKDDS